MFLQDEQNVIKWLSQYGALPKIQVSRLLRTSESAEEKILKNLQRQRKIAEVGGGYYWGLDKFCKPEQRTELAVWVLLQFVEQVDPRAHCPETYPAQLYFLKENTGYEIVVLYEGEEHLVKLLNPNEEVKYIIVVPSASMISHLKMPNVPCLFATVDFTGEDVPEVHFYSQEETADE